MRSPRSIRWWIAGRRTPPWLSWVAGPTIPSGDSPLGCTLDVPTLTARRYLAVFAGRKVPVVDRLLQELFGVVLPELADRRIGVDHGVLKLASHLLDFSDVDILCRVTVGVHLDGAARGVLDFDFPQGSHERCAILDLSADGFHRFAYCPRSGIAVLGVERRQPAELFFKRRAESLVCWCLEGGGIMVGTDDADGLIAELGQDMLVGVSAASDHRHAVPEAAGSVRIREKQGPPSQRQDEECVGIFLDLAEVWAVVLHVQRHPELLDDLTSIIFKALLKAARDFPSEGVIERDDRDLFIAENFGRVLAERMHIATRGEARSNQPLGALALGEVVCGVDRVDRRDLLGLDVRHERVRYIGEDDPG